MPSACGTRSWTSPGCRGSTSSRGRGGSRRSSVASPRTRRSVAPEALLAPRVAVHVVAVLLPEAGLVLADELERAEPLRRLPEVQVRDDEAGGVPVLGVERLAAEAVADDRVLDGRIRERRVRGVAVLGVRDEV